MAHPRTTASGHQYIVRGGGVSPVPGDAAGADQLVTGVGQGTNAVAEFFRLRQNEGKLKAVKPSRLAAYFVGMLLYELVHQRILGICGKPSRKRAGKLVQEAVDDFLLGYGLDY